MKLADTQDLGSCAARRAGSSPVTRTMQKVRSFGLFYFVFLISAVEQIMRSGDIFRVYDDKQKAAGLTAAKFYVKSLWKGGKAFLRKVFPAKRYQLLYKQRVYYGGVFLYAIL